MKKQLFASLSAMLMACAPAVLAQQIQQFSILQSNMFFFNPAVAGSEDFTDFKFAGRNQWSGFDGAPNSMYVSVHGAVTHFAKDTLGNETLKDRSGFGAVVNAEGRGPLNRTSARLAYAYHVPVAKNTLLSLGVHAGGSSFSQKPENYNVENRNDDVIFGNKRSDLAPDLGLGAMLYSGKFYVGVAMQQLLQSKLSFGGAGATQGSKLNAHTFVNLGYTYDLNEKLKLSPAIFVKHVSGAPTSFDINLRLRYENRAWAGLTLRNQDALVFMFGGAITRFLDVGYAFDLTSSELNNYTSGTHEIVLSYRLFGSKKEFNPIIW